MPRAPMIRRLYDWTLSLAQSPHALWALFLVAFAESSVFPIPPDVLMIPMILARPGRAFVIAGVALAGSVLGALLGYYIGAQLFDVVGRPVLEFYGKADRYDDFQALYDEHGVFAVAIGAITPFPFKVTTIVSGLLQMNLASFVLVCLLGRGFRFFLIAALLRRFFAERR